MESQSSKIAQPKKITLEATVIRKDGSREELGTVAYWHRNPFLRAFNRARGGGRVHPS